MLKMKYSHVDQEKRGLKEYGNLLKRFWKPNTYNLNFMTVRVQSAKNEKCQETRDARTRGVYSMRWGVHLETVRGNKM